MAFNTNDLSPRIGTRVHIDRDTLLSGAASAEIRTLLEMRGVVLIRGLTLDDEQQLAFTETLGPIGDENVGRIYKVSFDRDKNPHREAHFGTFSWHIDRTDTDVPPFASILNAKVLAPVGGETEFANTYAAYEDLPTTEKQAIEGLRVVHRLEAAYREAVPNPSDELRKTWDMFPGKVHPLVWRHRSGRRSLITSMSGAEVVGMAKAEGDALLKRMLDWASRPEFVYVHEWEVGDIVMWNNTGTMHRVRHYDTECGRLKHRTVVLGDEPFDPRGEEAVAA